MVSPKYNWRNFKGESADDLEAFGISADIPDLHAINTHSAFEDPRGEKTLGTLINEGEVTAREVYTRAHTPYGGETQVGKDEPFDYAGTISRAHERDTHRTREIFRSLLEDGKNKDHAKFLGMLYRNASPAAYEEARKDLRDEPYRPDFGKEDTGILKLKAKLDAKLDMSYDNE